MHESLEKSLKDKFRYVDYFFDLRCSSDVMRAAYPIGNNPSKEISESMSVIRKLKKIILDDEKNKYTLYDLCAGNALTSVIAAHLLPIKESVAINKIPRDRKWDYANKFSYEVEDINNLSPDYFVDDSIIVGVHACRNLSRKIIDLYKESRAKHLVIMPCCEENVSKKYRSLEKIVGKYVAWSFELALEANGKLEIDKFVLSPKNALITASKNNNL